MARKTAGSARKKSGGKKKSARRTTPSGRKKTDRGKGAQGPKLSGHFIVCGVGGIGRYVVEDLSRQRRSFVAVERDPARVERMEQILGAPFPFVAGDSTSDETLRSAGIDKAKGLITTFDDDKMNVIVTLSARRLNPRLRIVSRAVDHETVPKLRRAGADSVVSTNFIGGMRIASEMIRPDVVAFLDIMLKRTDRPMKIQEVSLGVVSKVEGRRLGDLQKDEGKSILVLAVRDARGDEMLYNPKADRVLGAGDTLFVMGHVDDIAALQKVVG
jgi:voltage-gated potassium channel